MEQIVQSNAIDLVNALGFALRRQRDPQAARVVGPIARKATRVRTRKQLRAFVRQVLRVAPLLSGHWLAELAGQRNGSVAAFRRTGRISGGGNLGDLRIIAGSWREAVSGE